MRVSAARDAAHQSVSVRLASLRASRSVAATSARIAPALARVARRRPPSRRQRARSPAAAAPPHRAAASAAAADRRRGRVTRVADLPPERRAIQVVGAAKTAEDGERQVDAEAARARGLTLVDLVRRLGAGRSRRRRAIARCSPGSPPIAATATVSRSRRANETTSSSTASRPRCRCCGVVSRSTRAGACTRAFDADKLLAVDEIRTWGASTEQKELASIAPARSGCEAARAAAGADRLTRSPRAADAPPSDAQEHLASRPSGRVRRGGEAARVRRADRPAQAQGRRLRHGDAHRDARLPAEARGDGSGRHQALDARGARAAAARERLLALERVLTERAVHAGGFIEDGSVGSSIARPVVSDLPGRGRRAPPRSRSGDGVAGRRRCTRSASRRPTTRWPSSAAIPRADFRWLKVAVAAARHRPSTTAAQMDLSVEIDRGDVWYDFPFDAAGVRQPQPRERFPQLTLFVKWRGERVPLVRWRTTVGGWRAELAERRAGVLPVQGLRRGPARLAAHRGGAGLDPAAVVAARLDGEGEARERHLHARHQLRRDRARAISPRTGWWPPSTRRCAKDPTARASSTTASARTARSTTRRCAAASRTAVIASTTSWRCGSSASCSPIGRRARSVRSPLGYRRAFWSQGRGVRDAAAEPRLLPSSTRRLPVDVLEGRIKGTLQKPMAGYVPQAGREVRVARGPRPPSIRPRAGRAGRRREAALRAIGAGARGARPRRRRGRVRVARPAPPAPARPAPAGRRRRGRARARRSPTTISEAEPPSDDAPTGGTVTIKLLADARRQAHVYWGRKDLGVAPLEIARPRGSGPLDVLVQVAPDGVPLHTRVFTDRDETLAASLRRAARRAGYSAGQRREPATNMQPVPTRSPDA